ncbi:glutamate-rich protein 6 isoform X1 [Xyrichtys novacula]|uniref:Glutamate-rich protein 6 isoform X1 n=1 Tax=Xyrichtys novacula TaxID=13765 RepID=A0AAV1GDN9_XYRNO|nr:glutamate-rich protein 6 isoform X1 [Xyrichtys novacula]
MERKPDMWPQSVNDLPTFGIRAAGVLKYKRESDERNINFTNLLESQPLTYPLKCEYCGEKPKPSLILIGIQGLETVPPCCERWQQLWETLNRLRHLAEGRSDLRAGGSSLEDNKLSEEGDELYLKGREKDNNQDWRNGEYTIYTPGPKPLPQSSRVLRFQYSSEGNWTVPSGALTVKHLVVKEKEEQVLPPVCNHKTDQFGMCHHQDKSGIIQKYYGNGLKFLTVFPDGSAQVFYPSGLLALIVVVTKQNGRVCIVYDDSAAPHQPIRAVFQSDGRATCYHSNGNTWLTLHRKGGQCLDEDGARVCRWSWASPLKPIFLSFNKAIGVRVLGQERVFVSFLVGGQQAKFSVGSCCAQAQCETNMASSGPSVLKEELFVLAARIRMQLPILHLHRDLTTPSEPLLKKTSQASLHHAVAQKLLEVSATVMMSESERDFIHSCLEGYV